MTRMRMELARWLITRRAALGISQRELGRRSGIANTIIADAEKGLGLSMNACKKLAHYLNKVKGIGEGEITPEYVMRLAGHLDKISDPKGALMNVIVEEAMPLDNDDLEELLAIIRMKRAKKKSSGAEARDTQRHKITSTL